MVVTLRPMDADEFARWLPRMRDSYTRDMAVNGGISEEDAGRKAAAEHATLCHPHVRGLRPGAQCAGDDMRPPRVMRTLMG